MQTIGRVEYTSVTDDEALAAATQLCLLEGIIPALESAHALAYLKRLMPLTETNENIVINLSGRGDKDLEIYLERLIK
jgi:tryptophan synthase beta chain